MNSNESTRHLSGVGFSFSVLPLLLLLSQSVLALDIHYSDEREAVLRECDKQQYEGEREASQTCYQSLLTHSSLLVQAEAKAALGDVKGANKLFREAAASDANPAIKTRWAELYMATHQISDASSLFREALLYDNQYLPAQLGLAEATMLTYEGKARESLKEILIAHPNNIRGLLLLAKIELGLQNLNMARGLLSRAEKQAKANDLPLLEIYALHASADLLDSKPIEPWVNKALDINPHYGDIYAIAAHYYIITYRYREAILLYQKAVQTAPFLATAQRDLGVNYLRINNLFGARYHMEKAFELDPFDAETINTLRLLDKIDGMRVRSIDVTDPDNPDSTIGRIITRLDTEDIDALEPYVNDLATKAFQTFQQRYQFQLKQPMIVELYHDHDDFGVRTVSTPGIGLLGVTFGYLTAMDSPKARANGEFHWGSTLWHEIAHVFTLEATNHLLPRWLSEGLSVYEEWNTGPLKNRELPIDTLIAISKQQLLPIASLDAGFVRPSYKGQVHVSYMQAGLICDFIAQRWGHDALVVLLKAYGDGEKTESALKKAIDMSMNQFDTEFGQYVDQRYAGITADLDQYQIAVRQLQRAMKAEDWASVEVLARGIIDQYSERVGDGNAYEPLALSQREQGAEEDAHQTLFEWYRLGGYNPVSLQRLIRELREREQFDTAAEVMEALNWVSPYSVDEHSWLGEYYLQEDQPDLALREFDALLGLQAENPAEAYLGKAKAARLMLDEEKARRQVLYALENAPFYRQAQHLLLELNEGVRVD